MSDINSLWTCFETNGYPFSLVYCKINLKKKSGEGTIYKKGVQVFLYRTVNMCHT